MEKQEVVFGGEKLTLNLVGKFWGQRKGLDERGKAEIWMDFIDKDPDDGSALVK
jgi:hypothetical protein